MTVELESVARNELILPGANVREVSRAALSRWNHLLLVEDDTARSLRRGATGVSERTNDVLIRVHRIGKSGIRITKEGTHIVGAASGTEKANTALRLLDQIDSRNTVIVGGTEYGSNSQFLSGLYERDLDAVLEVRPRTRMTRKWGVGISHLVPLSALISTASWQRVEVRIPGTDARRIRYSVTRLGAGYLESGHHGLFFALQTGAIEGLHPGTIFGFTQARDVTTRQLIEAIGWARWIRPVVRRSERPPAPTSPASNGNGHASANGTGPRLRANITLSRVHDQQRSIERSQLDRFSPRGALGSRSRVLNVVELFAGAGGMGLGFLLADSKGAGYQLTYSGEVDPTYVETLNTTHEEAARVLRLGPNRAPRRAVPADLRSPEAMASALDAATPTGTDVLIGGPPCQGFSNANRNSWNKANPHNQLVDVFLDYAETLDPRIFVMENVQGIHWTQKGGLTHPRSTVLEHVQDRMAAAGYEVFVQLLDSVWYGVPQYRSRFFVLGIHRDLGYRSTDFGEWGPFPLPSHGPGTLEPYVTVKEAIADLPRVGNGSDAETMRYTEPRSTLKNRREFLRFLRSGTEANSITDHVTSRHAPYVIDRYERIPPGGNWEDIRESLTNYADAERTHSNIYRRLTWDEPSVTIGHYRKSMLVHPSQHRGLSLREAARLQSFPDWFRFAGNPDGLPGGLVHKQQQLANAVCPLVSKAIAEFIMEL
jgi:DNA-cytosine methyltransferase